jgi:uncharacterized protein (TIGR03000 family)
MKQTWHWIAAAAAAAVLLWAAEPVLAQRHGGGGRFVGGGGRFVGGGFGGVRGGAFFGGPRVFAGGFGRFPGTGFGNFGGFGRFGGFPGAGFGRFGFGGFRRGFIGGPFFGGGFGGLGASWWGSPAVFGPYSPWDFGPYYWPTPYYNQYDVPYGSPYWFDGFSPDALGWSDISDHFAPNYAVLYAEPAIAVSQSEAGDSAVRLDVIVPDTAEVRIEGALTKQTGGVRKFVSPPLSPGSKYAYEVRARWSQDGRTVDRVQQVVVRAGDLVRVDFIKPPDLVVSNSDSPARQGPLNELGRSALARATR